MTRIEEDFATLERSRPEARGSAAVFDAAAGTARRRRRNARLASTGVAVAVAAMVVGGVALAGGGGEAPVESGPGVAGPPETTPTSAPPPTAAPETTTAAPGSLPSTTLPASSQLDIDDLTDVRVLSAGGADQVIFELSADAPDPSSVLEAAIVQPGDLPLDCRPEGLDAPAYLLVTLGAATDRDHLGVPERFAEVRSYDGARRVVGVGVGCVFDGELTAAIGLNTDQVATAVDALEGPPRLLVEVYPG